MSCLLEFGGAGGGGTPAGPSGAVQFNNAGAFGGDAGFTYAGSGQATLALGTITANAKALNITGTWNNAAIVFDAPLFMNITNTASVVTSLLMDFQIGGTTKFAFNELGGLFVPQVGGGSAGYFFGAPAQFPGLGIIGATATAMDFVANSNSIAEINGNGLNIRAISLFGFGTFGSPDTILARGAAAGVLTLSNGINATGYFVYNTVDNAFSPTNFERGVIDWTTNANVLTVGTQTGGTGANRQLLLTAGSGGTVTQMNLNFTGSITNQVTVSNVHFGFNGQGTLSSPTANDIGIIRVAAGVLGIGDNITSTTGGWYQWGGQSRTTASQNFTSTTTFAAVTGLTVTLKAGRTYKFSAHIPVTAGGNAGGIKVNIAGTATATAILYDVWAVSSNAITGQAQAASLGAANAGSILGAATGFVEVEGVITCNAAGTLIVQAAQNTSNATATTIGQGATFYVYDNA